MKKIDVEAHFLTEEYVNHLMARNTFPKLDTVEDENGGKFQRIWYGPDLCQSRTDSVTNRLLDLGEGRLKEMDAAGIDMQALSLCSPGCEILNIAESAVVARKTNDAFYQVTKKYPDRFIGLATLAPQEPKRAADELERAVKELGFKGANINSNIRGAYLDDQKYWPIFEKAEKLDVPIYLHPTMLSSSTLKPYTSYGAILAGPSLGFAAETALHVMRLICSGIFDKYPGLNIILGHLGEGLPFWLNRIDLGWLKPPSPGEAKPICVRKPSDYIKSNFFVTTSGMFFEPAFLCAYLALGADRIMFAVDYPFEDSRLSGQLMDRMPICDKDKEKISHLNADTLFKLPFSR
ncbi:MAG: amidohydrolase [Chloroflexi bacterium]|nr:amidohydrolase [Chloroflexota bacterium]